MQISTHTAKEEEENKLDAMMRKEVRLQAMTRMLNYIICNDSDDCMQF